MKKKEYVKPAAEKVDFSIKDTLMANEGGGTIGGLTPSTEGGSTEPFSLDEGYKIVVD